MPGRHITDRQMRTYMSLRVTHPTPIAAAKAGFRTASAYRWKADPHLPSQKTPPRTHRRPDALAGIWETEIVPMLTAAPGLRVVGLFEEIVSVVPAPSRTPIDKGGLGNLDDDRGRGVADGGALRSAARHWSRLPARSRKSATAAILSPTAMRARGFA